MPELIKILLGYSPCQLLFLIFFFWSHLLGVSMAITHKKCLMSVFSETGENVIGNTWCVEFFHKLQIQVSSKTKNDIGSL